MNNPFERKHLIRSFNSAANTYAAAVALPQEIGQRLIERLDLMRLQPNHILELGCATGYLSQQLAKRYPNAKVMGIDIAFKMVAHAKRQSRWLSHERFICADANNLPVADHSIDLIFANLTLAWCCNLDALLHELNRALKPQGLLLFTTLGPDTLQELRQSWAELDRHQHIHPFMDMHDVGDSLVKNSFLDPVMDMEKLTVNYPQIASLIKDLKALGMHNCLTERKKGLTTPRQWQTFIKNYERYRTTADLLPVTFEVLYGHAWSHETTGSTTNNIGEVLIPVSKIKRKHI